MIRAIQTFVLVTVVTLLIWVWADAETVHSQRMRGLDPAASSEPVELQVTEVPVLVAMGPQDEPLKATALSQKVDLVIAGPREAIERIRRGEVELRAVAVLAEQYKDGMRVEKRLEILPAELGLRVAGPGGTVLIDVTLR
jgi:hypothetical protein